MSQPLTAGDIAYSFSKAAVACVFGGDGDQELARRQVSDAGAAAAKQGDHSQHQKREEEKFRHAISHSSDESESEQTGDEGDGEKRECIAEHV